MNIQHRKTEKDYKQALVKLEQIFDTPAETAQGDEAEILSLLIDHYESKHYTSLLLHS